MYAHGMYAKQRSTVLLCIHSRQLLKSLGQELKNVHLYCIFTKLCCTCEKWHKFCSQVT